MMCVCVYIYICVCVFVYTCVYRYIILWNMPDFQACIYFANVKQFNLRHQSFQEISCQWGQEIEKKKKKKKRQS